MAKTRSNLVLSAAACACATAGAATADVLLFDITRDGIEPFLAAVEDLGYRELGAFEFDDLPDFGIQGILGWLTSDGAGPVPPGFIPHQFFIISDLSPHGVCPNYYGLVELAAVGPSAGFGNASNAIVANLFVDSFDVAKFDRIPGRWRAALFTAISLLGSDTVDLSIYGEDDCHPIAQFRDLPAPPEGHTYAVLATEGDIIRRFNLFDTGQGVEGVAGLVRTWRSDRLVAFTDFDVVLGTQLSGGLAEIESSNNEYLIVRSGFGRSTDALHQSQVVFHAVTNVPSPTELDLFVEVGFDPRPGIVRIFLRNRRTNELDLVGEESVARDDTPIEIRDISADDYVSDYGEIELTAQSIVMVPYLAFQFDGFFDWVEIAVE